ncbi:RIP metalloprotease RseP [Methylophaga sp. 41_12_T18]|nr:RIP metalloprotease RseP [Methylophaga sp. 41_12_T18]
MHSLFFFIIALSLLVVVHEFGHFWVARRCGVKVLKFSVGFGKALWSKQAKDGTEYVIAAIPLGGYVKMLDEREGEVRADELHQTFNRKPLRSRVAIVAAGPIANLLFAVFAYWLIFVMGMPGLRPIIADISPNSAAEHAEILVGDEIVSIDGNATPTWKSVYKQLWLKAEQGGSVNLQLLSANIELERRVDIPASDIQSPSLLLQQLGIEPLRPEFMPILGELKPGAAAEIAGLQKGDLLLTADDVAIDSWTGWVELIRRSPEIAISVTVQRQDDVISIELIPEKSTENIGIIGASVDVSYTEIPEEMKSEQRYGPFKAAVEAIKQTWQFTGLTVKSLFGMLAGTVSTENLGGPITIAQIAGSSADSGLIAFISFLAMISISLGVLNLLPIPILDGGHLALYFIEWLKGSAVSEKMQIQGQKIGIMLLLMLMGLAFFNDLTRLFG